jgi:lysozyme
MNISQNGIDLIKKFEGCVLFGYKDAVGVPTIGYGHTGGVIVGQVISQAKAEELLKKDLQKFVNGVIACVDVPVNQNQFDALVSFSFNCGLGSLQKSTLLKKLNAKDYAGAAAEFTKWNKAGGGILAGLTRRRAAELALFVKPVPKPEPKYPGLLKEGAKGTNVKLVQAKVGAKADGIFGPNTEASVKKWQKAHGLSADGIVGPKTWAKMF